MICLHEIVQSQLGSFGVKLQELRLTRGWTLQELAQRSGLSKAFLSRLESGDRQASIAAVLTLSTIFDVSLTSLFESGPVAEPCVVVRRTEAEEHSANGLTYTPLSSATGRFNLQALRVRVSRARRGNEHYNHRGEEWLYVLGGALTLSLNGRSYELETGDAAHFDSRLPHRLIPRGGRDAELIVVASPLAHSSPDALRTHRETRAIRLIDFSPAPSRTEATTTTTHHKAVRSRKKNQ